MTIIEAAERRKKAFEILKAYTVPGEPLTLIEGAPPEAEEALKEILHWAEINCCDGY